LADLDLARSLYLLPAGLCGGERAAAAIIAGNGWPIADGPLAFTALAVILREAGGGASLALSPFSDVITWAESESPELCAHVSGTIQRIGQRRFPWGGLPLDGPMIMGIINVTPDSFSDGGETFGTEPAIKRALEMVRDGAKIIDVGGESTRPGADPVDPEEEERRILPVIRALTARDICVSVDTRHARVMRAAIAAGAAIVNDVTALEGDPDALAAVAQSGAAICLMHMQGEDPRTMQSDPRYDCAPLDLFDHLAERVRVAEAAGIDRSRICVDPGIGFGKSPAHNAQILGNLALLHGLGCPILLGASRKSFVANLSLNEPPRMRLPGSLAANLAGLEAGAQILRVHDVAETRQALTIWRAMRAGA
jgi:dihydropteroate synthase